MKYWYLLLIVLVGCATGQAIYSGTCSGLCLALDGVVTTNFEYGDGGEITLEYDDSDVEAYALILYSDQGHLVSNFEVEGSIESNISNSEDYLLYFPDGPFTTVTLGIIEFEAISADFIISYYVLTEDDYNDYVDGLVDITDFGLNDELIVTLDNGVDCDSLCFMEDAFLVDSTDVNPAIIDLLYHSSNDASFLVLRSSTLDLIDSAAEQYDGDEIGSSSSGDLLLLSGDLTGLTELYELTFNELTESAEFVIDYAEVHSGNYEDLGILTEDELEVWFEENYIQTTLELIVDSESISEDLTCDGLCFMEDTFLVDSTDANPAIIDLLYGGSNDASFLVLSSSTLDLIDSAAEQYDGDEIGSSSSGDLLLLSGDLTGLTELYELTFNELTESAEFVIDYAEVHSGNYEDLGILSEDELEVWFEENHVQTTLELIVDGESISEDLTCDDLCFTIDGDIVTSSDDGIVDITYSSDDNYLLILYTDDKDIILSSELSSGLTSIPLDDTFPNSLFVVDDEFDVLSGTISLLSMELDDSDYDEFIVRYKFFTFDDLSSFEEMTDDEVIEEYTFSEDWGEITLSLSGGEEEGEGEEEEEEEEEEEYLVVETYVEPEEADYASLITDTNTASEDSTDTDDHSSTDDSSEDELQLCLETTMSVSIDADLVLSYDDDEISVGVTPDNELPDYVIYLTVVNDDGDQELFTYEEVDSHEEEETTGFDYGASEDDVVTLQFYTAHPSDGGSLLFESESDVFVESCD